MNLRRSLCLCAMSFFVSCGDPRPSQGGVDGNPNFLQGRVLQAGSRLPAISLSVVLERSSPDTAGRPSTWRATDTARTDSAGIYRFRLDADGLYRLESKIGDSTVFSRLVSFQASEGAKVDFDIPLPGANGILIDDFENPGKSSLATWFADASPWTLLNLDATRIQIAPASLAGSTSDLITNCAGQGKCMTFATTTLVAAAKDDFTSFYNLMRPGSSGCVSLPHADSVTLLAKGSGNLRLEVWVYDTAAVGGATQIHRRDIPLTAGWNRASLPLQSVRFDFNGTSRDWAGTCIHKVNAGLVGAGELWIDNVRIEGSTVLDLH